jgi:hypothetical protein
MKGAAIASGILAAVLLARSPLVSAQATPPHRPVFKAGVNYVEVDANVVDGNGRFVEGLTKDDFVVLENGKPQSVSVFSVVGSVALSIQTGGFAVINKNTLGPAFDRIVQTASRY